MNLGYAPKTSAKAPSIMANSSSLNLKWSSLYFFLNIENIRLKKPQILISDNRETTSKSPSSFPFLLLYFLDYASLLSEPEAFFLL